jgi:hypothetical protein
MTHCPRDLYTLQNFEYGPSSCKRSERAEATEIGYYFCGGREKVGKSNNFKNELTMFTP